MSISKRDADIFVFILSGNSYGKAAKEFGISSGRINQIFDNVFRKCKVKHKSLYGGNALPEELREYGCPLPKIREYKEILIPLIYECSNILTPEFIINNFSNTLYENAAKEFIDTIEKIKLTKNMHSVRDYESLINSAIKNKIIDWRTIVMLISCADIDKFKSAIPPDSNSGN